MKLENINQELKITQYDEQDIVFTDDSGLKIYASKGGVFIKDRDWIFDANDDYTRSVFFIFNGQNVSVFDLWSYAEKNIDELTQEHIQNEKRAFREFTKEREWLSSPEKTGRI